MASESTKAHSESVSNITLAEAVQLLQDAQKQGIEHVISVVRDPRNPSRILSINAAEVM